MKKTKIAAVLAAAVMSLILCSCEQKNSSITESQVTANTTTTKPTSLTIASQSATGPTTTTPETTTTRDPDNTVFTSKDMYHTEREGQDEAFEFCRFIVRKWAGVSNGEQSFDFTPYCKYSELAKYLDFTAKNCGKTQKFTDDLSKHLSMMSYSENGGSLRISAITISGQGKFYFIVQSADGKLVLCDMLFEMEDSPDLIIREGQLMNNDPEYWAKQGRYDEVVRKFAEESAKYELSEKNKLTEKNKDIIGKFAVDIADKWADYISGNMNQAFFRYCKYADLKEYFMLTWTNFGVDGERWFYPDKSDLTIESVTISGPAAMVRGTYPNYLKEQMPLVIIVENVDGKLMLNDLIYNYHQMPDNSYRPEIVKDPKPDYWKDSSRLAEIKNKMQQ